MKRESFSVFSKFYEENKEKGKLIDRKKSLTEILKKKKIIKGKKRRQGQILINREINLPFFRVFHFRQQSSHLQDVGKFFKYSFKFWPHKTVVLYPKLWSQPSYKSSIPIFLRNLEEKVFYSLFDKGIKLDE